jgi:hypothetical protein
MPIINGNITTGGTSQIAVAAGHNILGATFVATTEVGWLNFGSSFTWASTGVNITTDLITVTAEHNLTNRQAITVTGAGLPTGIVAGTVYYAVVTSPFIFGFATSDVNAQAGTLINLTTVGSGSSTLVISAAVNVGIPFFLNTPLVLSSFEYPDITKAWNIFSATTSSKFSIIYTTP